MIEPMDVWRRDFLDIALNRLYENDKYVINRGRERSAAARLASHLEQVLAENEFSKAFPQIRVDTDYRREGDDPKRNAEGAHVVPDIIIHAPGIEGPNIAVIEIKGWWNATGHEQDKMKLQGYRAKQGYSFGYFVLLDKDYPILEVIE